MLSPRKKAGALSFSRSQREGGAFSRVPAPPSAPSHIFAK